MEPEINPPRAFRAFRWLVFWIGDTRHISHFPWITWDVHEHKIDLNEVMLDAVPLLQPGDIVLHRDDGFLSNLFIGGAMIHAGLYVGGQQLIEALSGGVVKRHVGHILLSDRACILRPRFPQHISREKAVGEAIEWAEKIVGFPYDVLFRFNGQKERDLVERYGKDAAKKGVSFCCTEIPYFCYYPYKNALGIKRKRSISWMTKAVSLIGLSPGKAIISADMYITGSFDLIWCSKELTADWGKKRRVTDACHACLTAYWDKRKSPPPPEALAKGGGEVSSPT